MEVEQAIAQPLSFTEKYWVYKKTTTLHLLRRGYQLIVK